MNNEVELRRFTSSSLEGLEFTVIIVAGQAWIRVAGEPGLLRYWSRHNTTMSQAIATLASIHTAVVAAHQKTSDLHRATTVWPDGWDHWVGNPAPLRGVVGSSAYREAIRQSSTETLDLK